jgi:hypothetical protein
VITKLKISSRNLKSLHTFKFTGAEYFERVINKMEPKCKENLLPPTSLSYGPIGCAAISLRAYEFTLRDKSINHFPAQLNGGTIHNTYLPSLI